MDSRKTTIMSDKLEEAKRNEIQPGDWFQFYPTLAIMKCTKNVMGYIVHENSPACLETDFHYSNCRKLTHEEAREEIKKQMKAIDEKIRIKQKELEAQLRSILNI